MEASDTLSALHQHNSLRSSVVVVRRYTITHYIPGESSHLPYPDKITLSGDASSSQFPLHWLCLCKLLPFSDTEVALPSEEGEMGLGVFPHFQRPYGKAQKRITPPLTWSTHQIYCWSLCQPLIPVKKRAPRQREDWAFTQPSSFYKMSSKPELSWTVTWARKHRSWFEDMTIDRLNRPGGMRGSKHRWLSRHMPPFKRYFSQASLTLSSYCLGTCPLQFPFTTWAECWPLPCNRMRTSQIPQMHLGLMAHGSRPL